MSPRVAYLRAVIAVKNLTIEKRLAQTRAAYAVADRARTDTADRIARAIEAAPQCRCTDSYCTSRAAYANAARIARNTTIATQGATP